MLKSFGIGWQMSELHGWGIFGINLAKSLLKRGHPLPYLLDQPVLDEQATQEWASYIAAWQALHARLKDATHQKPLILPDTLIVHGFGNHFTGPGSRSLFSGVHNVGFIFFEERDFKPNELTLGHKMDLMLAGSRWNTRVLQELGFSNAAFVMQGVDLDRFQPRPPKGRFKDRFVIFSGGKLEFRKAQDIVLVAFREFHRRHPDSLLITAWHNPWPTLASSITQGPHGLAAPAVNPTTGQLDILGWTKKHGLPPDAVLDIGFIQNRQLPAWYQEVDVAVFPNRAEGGTNLVAMEVMACGIPCLLSANTGHLDIIDENHCYPLKSQTPLSQPKYQDWGETDPHEMIDCLEAVYSNRQESKKRGAKAATFIQQASWKIQTELLLAAISKGLNLHPL